MSSSSSSSSSSDQDSLEEDSSDNRSVEISSNESDSGPDKEMVEDRSIELMIFSPAGTTPAQADFPPIPIGDTPWIWEPEPPLNAIQTMADYTLACRTCRKGLANC